MNNRWSGNMEKELKIGKMEKRVFEFMGSNEERNKENLIKFVWFDSKGEKSKELGNVRVIERVLKSKLVKKKDNIKFLEEMRIELNVSGVKRIDLIKEMDL